MLGVDFSVPRRLNQSLTGMLQQLAGQRVIERLWQRDASLWHPSAETQAGIREALGWLDATTALDATGISVQGWLRAIEAARISDVLYVAPNAAGHIAPLWLSGAAALSQRRVHLLTTIDPVAVQKQLAALHWRRTAVVFAGSGAALAMEALVRAIMAQGEPPASVTTIGSDVAALLPSEALREWRETMPLPVPLNVSERWGALTAYGVAPAALAELQLEVFRAAALAMAQACQSLDPRSNPAFELGALLGVLAQHGRDKLTIISEPSLASVAQSIEAFVAGSLSKHGRGFVPIVGEPLGQAELYRGDRVFIVLRHGNQSDIVQAAQVEALRSAGHPFVTCTLDRAEDVAALVVCWQVAVAVAAVIIGVNPFDEPDTVLFEAQLRRRLENSASKRALNTATHASLEGLVRSRVWLFRRASWIALASYLSPTPDVRTRLAAIRALLRERYGVATVLVEPLRAAYAVQLLHAGRRDGLVLALSTTDAQGADVAASGWNLADLVRERRALDGVAWDHMGRATVPISLTGDLNTELQACYELLDRLL